MAIGQKALAYLPKIGITTPPSVLLSIESLKGAFYKVAEIQKSESSAEFFSNVKVSSRTPYTVATFNIGKGVGATGTVTLTGAAAADTVTVNGLVYTAVAGAKANNTEFSIGGTDTVDAADLADSINNDTRQGTIGDVVATSSAAVVTLTQVQGGTGGNATALAESTGGLRIAVSGATFTGGAADATQYTLGFVSEQQFVTEGLKGRAGLSSRRQVDVQFVNNAETFSVRSALAVVNFIQGLEDKVAQTGLTATGDGTYTDIILNGFTPFETFQWTVVKAGAVYTVTPTAGS